MIYLEDVWYEYPNGVMGLKGVSLRIEGNTFIGGYTGSGKSTLLRTFNGLIPNFYGGKFRGIVKVDGDVFLLGQNPDEQIVTSRVYDELALPLLHRGYDRDEVDKRVRKIARTFSLNLYEKTHRLSDGQKQLVAIASAIASGCEWLVLDEPFSNLHPKMAEKLVRLVVKRASVVMSEHRMEFSKFFEDFVWMEDGRISELRSEPTIDCVGGEIGEVVVRVEDVTFGYDEPLFEGLSFEVRRGEIFAIVGENGKGKSTLLKLMAGILKPWEGKIFIEGKVRLALAFPNYHLFEREVRREMNSELLKAFGLENVAFRHPHSLSFGQAKRVAIAKAFAGDIVLLDEPTAGQDFKFKERLLKVARTLRKTLIVATHDMEFAECCDEVLELR